MYSLCSCTCLQYELAQYFLFYPLGSARSIIAGGRAVAAFEVRVVGYGGRSSLSRCLCIAGWVRCLSLPRGWVLEFGTPEAQRFAIKEKEGERRVLWDGHGRRVGRVLAPTRLLGPFAPSFAITRLWHHLILVHGPSMCAFTFFCMSQKPKL